MWFSRSVNWVQRVTGKLSEKTLDALATFRYGLFQYEAPLRRRGLLPRFDSWFRGYSGPPTNGTSAFLHRMFSVCRTAS